MRTATIMITMAMAMATVMVEQCGGVGPVNKGGVSTKRMMTMMSTMARMSTTKGGDVNLIPPGDAAQRNRYQ